MKTQATATKAPKFFVRVHGVDASLSATRLATARKEAKACINAADYSAEGPSFYETVHLFANTKDGEKLVETLRVFVELN